MKILGIDFGTKRVGIATSDEGGTLAFPKETLPNNANLVESIQKMVLEEGIGEIVVGESVNFDGAPNKVAEKVNEFVAKLGKVVDIPIQRQQEFLTTVEARKSTSTKADFNKSQAHSRIQKERDGSVDASAAALILQRYLDKRNK